MEIFNSNSSLPTSTVEVVLQGNLGYDTSEFGSTDSILIIGSAKKGPVGVPIKVYDVNYAKDVFGSESGLPYTKPLLAEISSAYDNGARTIYALRLNGQDLTREFRTKRDGVSIEMSGMYPNNENKKVGMIISDDYTEITIFKPSDRATLTEKSNGLKGFDNIVKTIHLSNYGLSGESSVNSVLEQLKTLPENNVIRTSIKLDDENETVKFNDLHAGLYLLGIKKLNTSKSYLPLFNVSIDEDMRKVNELIRHIGVDENLPINGTFEEISDAFNTRQFANKFDFVEYVSLTSTLFVENSFDCSESKMTSYELYSKLGGYSNTCMPLLVDSSDISKGVRIVDDPETVITNASGIYPELENFKVSTRVLTVNGNTKISGKKPNAESFKISNSISQEIASGLLKVNSIVSQDERIKKNFKIDFESSSLSIDTDDIYKQEVKMVQVFDTLPSKYVDKYDKTIIYAVKGTDYDTDKTSVELYTIVNDKFVKVALDTISGSILFSQLLNIENTLVLVEKNSDTDFSLVVLNDLSKIDSKEKVFCGDCIYSAAADGAMSLLCGIDILLEDTNDNIYVAVEKGYSPTVKILFGDSSVTQVSDALEIINANQYIKSIFEFELLDATKENEFIDDTSLISSTVFGDSFEISYDLSKRVGYKTSDSFARQFGQHGVRSTLSTSPTHCVIGFSVPRENSLKQISDNFVSVTDQDYDMVAKNVIGETLILNNSPYDVGKSTSFTLISHEVKVDGTSFTLNGASAYGGLISYIDLVDTTTMKKLNVDYNYLYSASQSQTAKDSGFVTIKSNNSGEIVITDGVTKSPNLSYKRLSNVRAINYVERVIKEATEVYIGKKPTDAVIASVITSVDSKLNSLTGRLLKNYKFDVNKTEDNELPIDYEITLYGEIVKIRNRIVVKL